jgi:hypothetical protein
MIGFIDTFYTQLGTIGTALWLFYTLYISLLHTHYVFQFLLVVSWQRIYNSIAVTSIHIGSMLCTVLSLPCYFFSITLDCHLQSSTQFLTVTLTNDTICPFITPRHGKCRKHNISVVEKLIYDPLRSNGHHIFVRVCFCGNVFTESLPSNESVRHNIVKFRVIKCEKIHRMMGLRKEFCELCCVQNICKGEPSSDSHTEGYIVIRTLLDSVFNKYEKSVSPYLRFH